MLSFYLVERRDALVDGDAGTGVCAVGDSRRNVLGEVSHLFVEHSVVVGFQLSPFLYGFVPSLTFRCIFATFQIVECGFIGGDDAYTASHLNR